jgi:glycosyltransferase involved in cell wall biosynthesis
MTSAQTSVPPHIGTIVARFPKLTETFIVGELTTLERLGLRLDLFTVIHEHHSQLQDDARALDRRVHHHRLISPAVLGAVVRWLFRSPRRWARAWRRAIGGTFRSPPAMVRAIATVPTAMAFAEEMERLGVDRVHAHWATHPTLAAMVVRELTDLPFAFTGHAHDLDIEQTMLDQKVAAADLVITCTAKGRDLLRDLSPPSDHAKIRLLHHGVDLTAFSPTPLRDRPDPLRVLCVGSLEPRKGHRVLLAALARLRATGRRVDATLVGGGDDRAELEGVARSLGLADVVTFTGPQQRAEVIDWLAWCDVYVLPSIVLPNGMTEGIPNVLVEAMAAGRPVVASALTGVRELIDHEVHGRLFTPGDDAGLTEQLELVVADPEVTRSMVEAGRTRVEQEHDRDRCTRELYELLTGPWPPTDGTEP